MSNLTAEGKRIKKIARKYAMTEKMLESTTKELEEEKKNQRKLYISMVKLAQELKSLKEDNTHYEEIARFQSQKWYDGGIFSSLDLNPMVVLDPELTKYQHNPLSLTELFLDLIIITAFSRVTEEIALQGKVSLTLIFYFSIFWFIWSKESSYSTRFGKFDVIAQLETLLTCFAVLYGTLAISGHDYKRIIIPAAIVSFLHFLLHARVAYWNKDAAEDTYGLLAKKYAIMVMIMTFLETVTWMVGIFFVPDSSPMRWVIFAFGVLFSIRVPNAFLSNDFHSKFLNSIVALMTRIYFLMQDDNFFHSYRASFFIEKGGTFFASTWFYPSKHSYYCISFL